MRLGSRCDADRFEPNLPRVSTKTIYAPALETRRVRKSQTSESEATFKRVLWPVALKDFRSSAHVLGKLGVAAVQASRPHSLNQRSERPHTRTPCGRLSSGGSGIQGLRLEQDSVHVHGCQLVKCVWGPGAMLPTLNQTCQGSPPDTIYVPALGAGGCVENQAPASGARSTRVLWPVARGLPARFEPKRSPSTASVGTSAAAGIQCKARPSRQAWKTMVRFHRTTQQEVSSVPRC